MGTSAKCASTSLAAYMLGDMYVRWSKMFACGKHVPYMEHGTMWEKIRNRSKDFCKCAISSTRVNAPSLEAFFRTPCASETLFIFPVRSELSWFESALRQACSRSGGRCKSPETTDAFVKTKQFELRNGPSDNIR